MLDREDIVTQILEFIESLDFIVVRQGSSIQVFEVLIRHLAAMISAWDLLSGPYSYMPRTKRFHAPLYTQMIRLGDVLACAFDTPSGVPHDWVNPTTCDAEAGTIASVASASTVILEFGRLSDLTGNDTYVTKARRAEQHLLNQSSREAFPGLLGSFMRIEDGALVDSKGSWGAFGDCKPSARC